METSFYVYAHEEASLHALSLSRGGGSSFELRMSVDVQFDDSAAHRLAIACPLVFEGIHVLPENLSPKPEGPLGASAALVAFIAVDDLAEPEFDRFRYTFAPR